MATDTSERQPPTPRERPAKGVCLHRAGQAKHPVAMMARLLKVTRSGYYAWRARPASKRDVANAALTEVIKAIHEDSRRTYGARRVHAELLDEFELRVARHRVARLMRLEGLQ